jgi:MFS transporter, PPP family, 3-phenylpropionic acid transporter
VRRPLGLAWLYYFFYFGAFGCYVPFLTLYFEQAGLNGRAIGLLAALPPLVQLAVGPIWGGLGDRLAIHRRLLPLATLGPIVPSLLMLTTHNLAALTALVIIAGLFTAPILLLIDSAVLDMVRGTHYAYGKIRIGGSIGYTLGSWLMGYLLKAQGLHWLFYGYGGGLLVAGLLAFALPARRQVWQATSFSASVGQLLRQRPLVLFLIGAFLVSVTLQASFSFFPLRLVALGGDPVWVGLAGVIGAVCEMPVLFYSGAIFRRLGVRPAVTASYLLFALRWGILALAGSPALMLATTTLNGLTFTPYMAGGILYVEQHTPAGLHATAQGLLAAVTFGLGSAVGALGGGVLYDVIGAQGLFGVGAAVAAAAAGFVVLAGRATDGLRRADVADAAML